MEDHHHADDYECCPPSVVERPDLAADLDPSDDTITALDCALPDAAEARSTMDTEVLAPERIETGHVLSIDGGNAQTHKARLMLTLADHVRYETCSQRLRAARQRLLDAERRVTVSKERCRLLRAAVALRLARIAER